MVRFGTTTHDSLLRGGGGQTPLHGTEETSANDFLAWWYGDQAQLRKCRISVHGACRPLLLLLLLLLLYSTFVKLCYCG